MPPPISPGRIPRPNETNTFTAKSWRWSAFAIKLLLNCCVAATVCGLGSCMKKAESTEKSWVEQAVENARCQIGLEIDTIEASGKVLNPVTLNENRQVYYCGFSDWRSGFSQEVCGICMNLRIDNTLLSVAQKYTEAWMRLKNLLGIMI